MKSAVLVTVVCLLTPVPVSSTSSTNLTYVGCYSTTHPESSLYKVQHPMCWEECVSLCDHRMTRYVGVQENRFSGPANNVAFCVNSLVEQFHAVDSALCRSCAEDPERYCGGPNTMSVYQLRDSVPLAILLATDSGVSMFSSDTSSTTIRVNHTSRVDQVDFLYGEDKIFFVSDKKGWSTRYGEVAHKYLTPIKFQNPVDNVGRLAVDWVTKQIYMEAMAMFRSIHIERLVHALYVKDASVEGKTTVLDFFDVVQDFEIDPYNRIVFFIVNGVLHSYGLEDKARKDYDNADYSIKRIKTFALDTSQKTVYFIGIDGFERGILFKIGYEGSTMRTLHLDSILSNPFGLDVSGDMIVWGNQDGGQYTLYTCSSSLNCWHESARRIYEQEEPIFDIKIYQSHIQTSNLTKLCLQLSCSHECTSLSQSVVQCTCPGGMTIEDDMKTCKYSTIASTISTDATFVRANTTETLGVSTKENEILKPLWTFTEETTSEILSSTELFATIEATAAKAKPKSDQSTLEMFLVMGLVITVVLLVGFIYLNIKAKRYELHDDLGNKFIA